MSNVVNMDRYNPQNVFTSVTDPLKRRSTLPDIFQRHPLPYQLKSRLLNLT